MHALLARPWLTLAIAVAGVALAYTAFTLRSGGLQAADGGYCPAKQVCIEDGTCTGPNCPHCNKKV